MSALGGLRPKQNSPWHVAFGQQASGTAFEGERGGKSGNNAWSGAMNIGFLRAPLSMDEMRDEMDALEKAGCERIVVDSAPAAHLPSGMLAAVLSRLSSGDTLLVWGLDSVANSMPELVELALQLEDRNVRLRSLHDGFDTHGKSRAVLKSFLQQLQEFQQQSYLRHEAEAAAARRVGRPRSLSPEKLERAHHLLAEGHNMDEVAKEFQVSRATLYRYLHEERS